MHYADDPELKAARIRLECDMYARVGQRRGHVVRVEFVKRKREPGRYETWAGEVVPVERLHVYPDRVPEYAR